MEIPPSCTLQAQTSTSVAQSWSCTETEGIDISHAWTIKKFSLRREKVGEALKSVTFPSSSSFSNFHSSNHSDLQYVKRVRSLRTTGSSRYDIQDRSQDLVNGTMSTKSFTTWGLEVYPKGRDEDSKDFVSVFLRLVSSNETEVRVLFKFSLANAKQEKLNIIENTQIFKEGVTFGYDKFIKRNLLLDKANGILLNGNITIYCEVSLLGSCDKHTFFQKDQFIIPECRLSENFGQLLEDKKFSDVILSVNGMHLLAHKAILSARSPVFAAMFEHQMQENIRNEVEITDMKYEVLKEMLRFVYTGHAPGLKNMAADMLAAADKYCLERLKIMCEEVLCSSISVETVCKMLIIADVHNAPGLKAHAIRFINAHATAVVKTADWKTVAHRHLHLITEAFLALHGITKQAKEASLMP